MPLNCFITNILSCCYAIFVSNNCAVFYTVVICINFNYVFNLNSCLSELYEEVVGKCIDYMNCTVCAFDFDAAEEVPTRPIRPPAL